MCLGSKTSRGLDGHWYEVVCSSQLDVLRHFSQFHLVCYSTSWRCEGVKVSGQVVSQTRTQLLFYSITVAPSRLFLFARQISHWFQVDYNLSCCQRPLNEVTDCHVTRMMAKPPLAMKTESSLVVYSCSRGGIETHPSAVPWPCASAHHPCAASMLTPVGHKAMPLTPSCRPQGDGLTQRHLVLGLL